MPLPKPTLSPSFALARPGTFLRVGFFTAAVWCVPALRVPLVHSLINHFRQKAPRIGPPAHLSSLISVHDHQAYGEALPLLRLQLDRHMLLGTPLHKTALAEQHAQLLAVLVAVGAVGVVGH